MIYFHRVLSAMAFLLTAIAALSLSARSQVRAPQSLVAATASEHLPAEYARALAGGANLRFTENNGQVADTRGLPRPDILYTASSSGMRLFLRRDGVSYVFARWVPDSSARHSRDNVPGLYQPGRPAGHFDQYRMDITLIGANPNAGVTAEDGTADMANYYLAQCPGGITHVRSYHRVTYRDIYPHIDLVFHGDTSGMKYDFVVHPGGRVADIAWRYTGAASTTIGANGALDAATALGNLVEAAPYAYQDARHDVGCRYIEQAGRFSYTVAAYDSSATLVIDPALQWATYLGGSANEATGVGARGIAADAAGNVAVAGITASLDFPATPGVTQPVFGGGWDIFVAELGSAGNLIWCTYWGGDGYESASSVSLDGLGHCVVVGWTEGQEATPHTFPIGPNAFQPLRSGMIETVIGQFDATGIRRWSTFLGGTRDDGFTSGVDAEDILQIASVATDQQGNIVVSTPTLSLDFPTRTPWQTTNGGGVDVAIARFSVTGTLLWSSYFGGSGNDKCTGIAITTGGDIVVCGTTTSADLPLFGTPFQPALQGPKDAFILKVSSAGVPRWSTHYGTTSGQATLCYAVATDVPSGAVVIAGLAAAGLPTTATSFQNAPPNGLRSGFVAKFDGSGRHLWSTYYGGSNVNLPYGLAIGNGGDILFGGITNSPDFPVTANAYQAHLKGSYDAFLAQLDANGAQKWSTYYGGTGLDEGSGLAFGASSAYMIGGATSADLTGTATGFQPANAGGYDDDFIVKFSFCTLDAPIITATGPLALCDGDSVTITAPAGYARYQWSPNNETGSKITVKRAGVYSVTTTDGGGCVNTSQTLQVKLNKKPQPAITPTGPITICSGDSVKLSARQNGIAGYRWSNNDSLDEIWVKAFGVYFVVVTDTNGCTAQSLPVTVRVNASPVAPVLSSLDTIWICSDSLLRLDAGPGYASYQWSPGNENVRLIQARAPLTYYVDVSNALGCRVRSDTVVVRAYLPVPARLVVDGGTEFCSGDSVVLRAPSGFSAPRWSNGATGPRLVVRANGLYYATAIDSNGCRERTDSVRVTVHPSPKADITGPARVCLNANSTYGTSSGTTFRYEWSMTGDGSIQGAGDGASIRVQWGAGGGGTVTLRVTDISTGCATTSKRDVTIGTSLTPVITPSGAIVLCAGDSIELDAGAGYASYAWSNGAPGRTIWINDSAAYAVTVVDPSGCRGTSDTVRARIEARPAPAIAGPLNVCRTSNGGYSVAALPGASYSWAVSGGAITGGDGTPAISVQWGNGPAGTVDVTVTSAAGCAATATQARVEIGSSLKPVIAPGGNPALCTGDSIELDAGAGYTSYAWSSGEATERIIVRAPGSYAVTVSDASGCSGTSDSVHVALNPPPVVTIVPTGPIALKAGDTIILDAGSGYAAYRWTRGTATIGFAQQLTAPDSGDYAVTVTDAHGCTGSAVVHIDREASTSGTAALALGDASAAPGENVEIPLRLVSSANLALAGASGYQARVRYHASLLIPTGNTPRGTLDGEDRVLTVAGNLPAGIESGEIGRLEFIAALGDDSLSALKLESVTWLGAGGTEPRITSTLRDGMFHLTGLCTNGGARLIRAGGEEGLKSIVPNPANNVVRIEYDLVEDGPCRLSIVDVLGREVRVVQAGDQSHGAYTTSCDIHSLASGMYTVVLATATARMSAVMEVGR